MMSVKFSPFERPCVLLEGDLEKEAGKDLVGAFWGIPFCKEENVYSRALWVSEWVCGVCFLKGLCVLCVKYPQCQKSDFTEITVRCNSVVWKQFLSLKLKMLCCALNTRSSSYTFSVWCLCKIDGLKAVGVKIASHHKEFSLS